MTRPRSHRPLLLSALLVLVALPAPSVAQSSPAPCAPPVTADPPVVAVPGGDAANSAPQPGPTPATPPSVCWIGDIGSPLVAAVGATGDTVLSGTDTGALVAFGPDGAERWRYQAGDTALAVRSFALDATTAYVATSTGVVSVSIADGSEGWRYEVPPSSGPVVVDTVGAFWTALRGTTLLATTHTTTDGFTFERLLVALDAATGSPLWSAPLTPDGQIGRPAADDSIVALAAGAEIRTFDLATGAPGWTATSETIGGPVATDLVFGAGQVLTGLADGSVVAVATADGSLTWRTAAAEGSGRPLGLAANGDTAYLNTGLQLIAFDAVTGATPWGLALQQSEAMFAFRATPAIVDGEIIVGTTDAMDVASLVAVSDTGAELWRSPTDIYGAILSPVVLGGRVYAATFGLTGGGLLAFGTP